MSTASRKRVLLLDANLLLLLIVGSLDAGLIARLKRLQSFSIRQYEALADIVGRADALVTTPHLLTEVSNLANSFHEGLRSDFAERFRLWIALLREQYTPAQELSQSPFFRFGLADSSMLHAGSNILILTQDGRFASQIASHKNVVVMDLLAAIEMGHELFYL